MDSGPPGCHIKVILQRPANTGVCVCVCVCVLCVVYVNARTYISLNRHHMATYEAQECGY